MKITFIPLFLLLTNIFGCSASNPSTVDYTTSAGPEPTGRVVGHEPTGPDAGNNHL